MAAAADSLLPFQLRLLRRGCEVRERRARCGSVALGRGATGGGEVLDRGVSVSGRFRGASLADRAGGDDRVGYAGVQSARSEGGEEVGGLADEQHAAGGVDELACEHLQEDVGRDPRHAVGVLGVDHEREPALHALRAAERLRVVVGAALEIDAPVAGERDEEDVAPVDRGVLVVEDPLDREGVVGILRGVDDHECVLRSRPFERDLERAADVRARPVRADHVVGLEALAGLGDHRDAVLPRLDAGDR